MTPSGYISLPLHRSVIWYLFICGYEVSVKNNWCVSFLFNCILTETLLCKLLRFWFLKHATLSIEGSLEVPLLPYLEFSVPSVGCLCLFQVFPKGGSSFSYPVVATPPPTFLLYLCDPCMNWLHTRGSTQGFPLIFTQKNQPASFCPSRMTYILLGVSLLSILMI